jgi:acyl carrier protein
MNDYEGRLLKCFDAVFPGLSEVELRAASTTNLDTWDSIAGVTLITLIEEEFGVELEAEDLERLVSFESVLSYVKQAANTSEAS